MDNFRKQVLLFIEISVSIKDKCIENKNIFKDGTFNALFIHPEKFEAKIYFNDDFKVWSIEFDGFKYSNYKDSFEFNLSKITANQISDSNEILRKYYNNFDNIHKGKKRTLNFNK
jgi:hypothetical protein